MEATRKYMIDVRVYAEESNDKKGKPAMFIYELFLKGENGKVLKFLSLAVPDEIDDNILGKYCDLLAHPGIEDKTKEIDKNATDFRH